MALAKLTTLTTLFTLAQVASNATTVGPAVDVSGYLGVDGRILLGRATATPFNAGFAPTFRLEGTSVVTSPTAQDWKVLVPFQAELGTSLASQLVSGTEAAGQIVVTLAGNTNFGAPDYVFFHNTTLANSEWSRVASNAGNDLTLEEAIVNAQTGSTCRDQAEQYDFVLDVTSLNKIRLVVSNAGSGQAIICKADFGAVSSLS